MVVLSFLLAIEKMVNGLCILVAFAGSACAVDSSIVLKTDPMLDRLFHN